MLCKHYALIPREFCGRAEGDSDEYHCEEQEGHVGVHKTKIIGRYIGKERTAGSDFYWTRYTLQFTWYETSPAVNKS